MIEYEPNNVLAETIARVVAADDLADVCPDDIDTFLDTLEWEPFTDAQVQRICGRLTFGTRPGSSPTRPLANPRPPDRSERGIDCRARRTRGTGYRLACEELEARLPPSVYAGAADAPALDLGVTPATGALGQTVRLWQDGHVVQVQGRAEAHRGWREDPGEAAALSDAFAAGASRSLDDDDPSGLPWESLFNEVDCPCEAACGLQLAG
jgi:hypothetical protein